MLVIIVLTTKIKICPSTILSPILSPNESIKGNEEEKQLIEYRNISTNSSNEQRDWNDEESQDSDCNDDDDDDEEEKPQTIYDLVLQDIKGNADAFKSFRDNIINKYAENIINDTQWMDFINLSIYFNKSCHIKNNGNIVPGEKVYHLRNKKAEIGTYTFCRIRNNDKIHEYNQYVDPQRYIKMYYGDPTDNIFIGYIASLGTPYDSNNTSFRVSYDENKYEIPELIPQIFPKHYY